MRAVKDDSAVPLCGGRSEMGGEAEGGVLRGHRDAMKEEGVKGADLSRVARMG